MSQQYTDLITTVYPEFRYAAAQIRMMTLKHRSTLLKCCQAQYVVRHDDPSTLYRMVSSLPPFIINKPTRLTTLYSFLQEYGDFITGPVSSAIIIDIARGHLLDFGEVKQARIDSWNKELICCESEGRPNSVDWTILFNPSRWDENWVPGIPSNRKMTASLYSSLQLWKHRMNGRILYPRGTNKNMSRDTRRHFEAESRVSLEDVTIFGQTDWLKYYLKTGHKIPGVCEMRQKWYPSGAKPRTYYAQGGTTFAHSMYLQDVATALVDSSPITNHVSRLRPTRLRLRDDGHIQVYDLTSFTSRMSEQKFYVRELANFAYGTPVFIWDPCQGLVERDLGDMLWTYNEECNIKPEVSYERCFGNQQEIHIGVHGMASMLGIFGNLMTCTMAHASLVAQAVEDEDELNVAGDDGAALKTEKNAEVLDICICHIGDYELEKTFSSEEPGCICLKRPLYEEEGMVRQHQMCIPPNMSLIRHHLFHQEDSRFQFFDDHPDPLHGFNVVGKDLMRFLRSVHRMAWKLDDGQICHAVNLVRGLNHRFKTPRTGGLPQCGDSFFWPSEVEIEEIRETDPLDTLILNRFRGHVVCPVQSYEEIEEPMSQWDVGDSFRANKTKHVGFLEKLGLVKCERVVRYVEGEVALTALRRLYLDFSTPLVYNVVVLASIPVHLRLC